MNRIGAHLPIGSGIDPLLKEIQLLNINTLQIFSGSPRTYRKTTPINSENLIYLEKKLQEINIYPLIVHAPYLVNLGSLREDVALKSAYTLENEIRILEILNGQYLVFHSGSSKTPLNEKRMSYYLSSLSEMVPPGIQLLLENNAGGETSKISYLHNLIKKVSNTDSLGICLDTCHLFAAGYDLRTNHAINRVFEEADGMVKLIHLNDSRGTIGSGVDRHTHIGKGNIGLPGMITFLHHKSLNDLPIIIETPKDSPDADSNNLKIIRHILGRKIVDSN
ncbi:MAG: putative endonuclease 4 [candidate division WS2 bacterium]|uniref:Endonuclease 4 n=1 Tax=Psychracetigena formicireducens TaxID=2986056 RepID=A0A9E2BHY9_PSYF1|nr:putative endonuclease 4 [Candidatus Psychracetigena formicireducens]MBT9144490.1 putative endonuclease 4 [Candidatus Psychracetigena formicireducens]